MRVWLPPWGERPWWKARSWSPRTGSGAHRLAIRRGPRRGPRRRAGARPRGWGKTPTTPLLDLLVQYLGGLVLQVFASAGPRRQRTRDVVGRLVQHGLDLGELPGGCGPAVHRHRGRCRAVPGGGHRDRCRRPRARADRPGAVLPEACAADEEHRELAVRCRRDHLAQSGRGPSDTRDQTESADRRCHARGEPERDVMASP
jgi:hypothetical protein